MSKKSNPNSKKEKMHRVDIIVLLIFSVVGLFIPAVIVLQHFIGIDLLAALNTGWVRTVFGVIFTVLAAAVCTWNFYVSIFVPWSYERKHGSMKGFAHTSGLPFIGGIFILFAGALMPASLFVGIFLLVLYIFDGNGLMLFLIYYLKEQI